MVEAFHKSVLLAEVLEALDPASGRIFCDVTLGDGGHAEAILTSLGATGLVIGIDRDAHAIERAQQRLAPFGDRFKAVHGNFAEFKELLRTINIRQADGIVCDLGVSMLQISNPSRGFMFSANGPLDMRMQADKGLSAEKIINELSESKIADIMWRYGEERKSRRIAHAIVKARQQKRLTTTTELAAVVRRAVGEKFIIKSLARVFQSFRIYINDEIGSLERFLPQSVDVLKSGGRLAIIEYHSLEGRVVKDFIYRETHPCICPKDLPQCVCGREPTIKVVRKLVKATATELENNPGARSARLRVIEKL
ncbi:16S rRNA (cytosine(1402)-N(4))-methyltransferase RsmH [candidate division KSB1 bacterium]|nr:16S rRNA (cytosine(1402)-N(4))-methyltransferase RsmH [candidate division KSB1 bacterium]RQW04367.1 MAG: 16S rRNA (cytosine(1402)-N(4))-methyltransferase RsmH [candidate division KSB1 bacterium]